MRKTTAADAAWAHTIVHERRVVVHIPTGTIDEVKAVNSKTIEAIDIAPDKVGDYDAQVIVTLKSGHEFHGVRENFIVLDEKSVMVWQVLVDAVPTMVRECAVFAASTGVPKEIFEKLAACVLAEQVRALQSPRKS